MPAPFLLHFPSAPPFFITQIFLLTQGISRRVGALALKHLAYNKGDEVRISSMLLRSNFIHWGVRMLFLKRIKGHNISPLFYWPWFSITCFFYKHGVFQSEARICLSFHKSSLKICLKYAYLRRFKRANFLIWPTSRGRVEGIKKRNFGICIF